MGKEERILEVVYWAVDEVNKQLSQEEHLSKSPATALFGPSGMLDSLGIINFITAVEKKLKAEFGSSISLVNESSMSEEHPLQTIGTLVKYISQLLNKNASKV